VSTNEGLPVEAYAASLVDLPGMGPARLVALLRENPPDVAWRQIVNGEVRRPDPSPGLPTCRASATWAEAAARRDVGRRWAAMQTAGIHVAYFHGDSYPRCLAGDPEPPGVLFWLGDIRVLRQRRVAIVGTRRATNYGRSVAVELGRDLAQCGVCVISGLALGIDGAAHQGALLATTDGVGPVGVAASGVDTPYPRKHADLWRRVAAAGAVISETPPRQPAQSWRFPARNRIIAGLAQAVVVVESHAAGGSMLTVGAAADRGVDILAVPGPVTSPSSTGTNQLLHEGLAPARHAGDVLAALGDLQPWPPDRPGRGASAATRSSGPRLGTPEKRVLDAIDRTPTSTSVISDRTGLPIGTLSVVLLQLEGLRMVRSQGAWWERCDDQ
jgi:DNA processing protein